MMYFLSRNTILTPIFLQFQFGSIYERIEERVNCPKLAKLANLDFKPHSFSNNNQR